MPKTNTIRTVFAREHSTIFPKLGVFLAGPTPPDGAMENSWRRLIMKRLAEDKRLDASTTIVAPEPRNGHWSSIDGQTGQPDLDYILDKQIPWEWQYLQLCDITAFWLPTYWTAEQAGVFPANIGPTSRWEFGFFLQEYLKSPKKRSFIIGAPEDAESVKWAKRITDLYDIPWHSLPVAEKDNLVADSFIEAIAQQLIANRWNF